ncbi:response regulator [Paenibacillus nanensis]|uniref:Response regulator n=1 Tax=Paenibacillus nanensis TaxID=393251 RepID=A0A3A1US56_9BACL|nr:response regulator [Paenibacillus nanensis]RIX50241.1 response regulator [Paenibacillus nanensis]
MNLIIVEDEIRLRQGLANNIPWEEHGIEVVGLAANGVEALRLAERKRPDIMLIDVQMPEMDGLTLARKLRERPEYGSMLKLIILSGHDNFGYAQDAMAQGVSQYLLKPAAEDEILAAVLEAARQLRAEMERWREQSELKVKWQEHLPHLQSGFFQQWTAGVYETEEVLNKCREYQIGLSERDRIAVALVDVDSSPQEEVRFKAENAPMRHFSLQCLAKELLPAPSCWVCPDRHGYTLLVFTLPPEDNEDDFALRVQASVMQLLSRARETLDLTASAGICSGAGSVGEMSELYAQAFRALQERIVYGHDIVIPYREQERKQQGVRSQPALEKALEIALELADETKALEALQDLCDKSLEPAESAEEVHEAVLYLSSLFIRMIQKQGWMIKDVAGDDTAFFGNVRLLTSKEHTRAWLARNVAHICAYLQRQRRLTSNGLIRSILAIVDQEIDRDITLHTVADRLFVNSSYVSRLFKQETGVSFSAYVLERKMERAKAVLQEGGKVYDAARLVGYRDVSYFTKVFRKYWGITPGGIKA